MYLKSYSKLGDFRLAATAVTPSSQRGNFYVDQEGALLRAEWGRKGNHVNVSVGRLPFSVISTNTLRFNNGSSSCSSPCWEKQTAENDAPLDIWSVIKPGNVQQKIAIFAPPTQGPDTLGVAPLRPTAVKVRGRWDGGSSTPKRRRRSGSKPQSPQSPVNAISSHPTSLACDPSPNSGVSLISGGVDGVCVGEMVAFLEQRVSGPLLSPVPISRASCSLPEEEEEEAERETLRVSDMVARLESQCLKGRTLRGGDDVSPNNSLRRMVGRVLLARPKPEYVSPPPSSIPSSLSLSLSANTPRSVCSSPSLASPAPLPSPEVVEKSNGETSACCMNEEQTESNMEGRGGRQLCQSTERRTSPQSEKEEPLPGQLFFCLSSEPHTLHHTHTLPQHTHTPHRHTLPHTHVPADSEPCPFQTYVISDLEAISPPPSPSPENPVKRPETSKGLDEVVSPQSAAVLLGARPAASPEFLELRLKLQLLLEPQPYLLLLPHHLLLRILSLLPTRSLAALKCSCHYFQFIIEMYGVRPADSCWVCDPRYRDDPCKQCKKRYGRGDVSLCRWHHKPYYQALPYGPGYWMCCHGTHKDTPGCNVGLHDNHWVPAFHSIHMPIYKKHKDPENI